MPIHPRAWDIRFAVAGRAERVDANHPIWADALPVSLRGASADSGQTIKVTHGDYFRAVQTYLRNDGARHLQAACVQTHPTSPPTDTIEKLDVILEKHGEFYHPARIRIVASESVRSFVLNVALTPAGIECMHSEIQSLRQVTPRLPAGFLPCIHGVGHVDGANGLRMGMFLADWFEKHHEFHLSVDPDDGVQKIIVWNTRQAPYFLRAEALADVYAQTAYLMTRAYDPNTTRQIYPWHHASGDFVLRMRGTGMDVKLITVRQYAPTLGGGDGQNLDAESRLMAAMVFFANLTLRNRIDRLDGTGELAWADDAAVAATVAGFKRAMDASLSPDLENLLRSYDADDWHTLLGAVAAQYRLMPAEEDLLDRHLADHADCLQAALRREYPV